MMNWSKQTQDLFNSWSEAQKNLWDTLSTSIPDYQQLPNHKLWEQTLATGQQAVENTLNAQADWANKWVEYLEGVEGLPSQVLESAQQFQEISSRWGETQEQLWKSWFEMLKGFDMSKMSTNWGETGQNPFQIWQENTKKIMETQANWTKTWFNAYGGEGQDE